MLYAEAMEAFFFRRFHVPRVSSEHGRRAHARPPHRCSQVGAHARDFTHLESVLTQMGDEG